MRCLIGPSWKEIPEIDPHLIFKTWPKCLLKRFTEFSISVILLSYGIWPGLSILVLDSRVARAIYGCVTSLEMTFCVMTDIPPSINHFWSEVPLPIVRSFQKVLTELKVSNKLRKTSSSSTLISLSQHQDT